MTADYLRKQVARARTVFNKAFDLHEVMEKNFGEDSSITENALTAEAASYKVLEELEYLLKRKVKGL